MKGTIEQAHAMREEPTRQLTLLKGREWFVVRYTAGSEGRVLDALKDMAQDPAVAFDWFDAATLSHRLGMLLSQDIKASVANNGMSGLG